MPAICDFDRRAKQVTGAEILPDGHYVAYVVQQPNWEQNFFDMQIWVAQLVTRERYQLTSGKSQARAQNDRPPSKRIAFSSDHHTERQIYIISPSVGETAQLTAEDNGVAHSGGRPTGRRSRSLPPAPTRKRRRTARRPRGQIVIRCGHRAALRLRFRLRTARIAGSLPN